MAILHLTQLITMRTIVLLMLVLSTFTCGTTSARPAAPAQSTQLVQAVCHDSGLSCVQTGIESLTKGPGGGGATVARDFSIATINDFQRNFFLESELVVGSKMHLDSNLADPIPAKPFLTSAAAAKVPPLTLSNVLTIMAHFKVTPKSEMATAIGTSAFVCGNPALPGEARSCPISLESLGSFVAAQLGTNVVEIVATSGAPKVAPAAKAPVTVVGVKKGSIAQGERIVVCHHIPLPSKSFYCHTVSGTKVVKADMQDTQGNIIAGVGVCHLNTALWLASHPAFAALQIPKGAEACHMLVENDLVFMIANKGSELE